MVDQILKVRSRQRVFAALVTGHPAPQPRLFFVRIYNHNIGK
jgi:hypothetical protein